LYEEHLNNLKNPFPLKETLVNQENSIGVKVSLFFNPLTDYSTKRLSTFWVTIFYWEEYLT